MHTHSSALRPRRLARSIAVSLAILLLPALATAQTAIRAGTPVQGTLDANSPRADDGTPYALYEYSGRAGERIRVTQTSTDFDSFLAVGSSAAPGCSDDCKYDDDSAGELNARVNFTVPASGKVQIRVNSISSDARGDYRLELTSLPAPAPARAQALRLETETRGRLSESSARDEEERPYDLWTVSGRRNQEVVVRLNSDAFDSFVEFGRMERNQFVSSASDDDGGSGLNAKLRVTLDAQGRGAVKVTTAGGEGEGEYTLFVGEPPAARPIVVQTIEVGGSVRGKLDDSDSFDEEEIRFDVFKIEGRPGQRVVARLQSDAFDPILKWGVLEGDVLLQDAMDDDSGGGSSAQLSLTLDEDGIGRLVATSLGGGTGEYTLSIVGAPRPATTAR
jgi:hypothetical protein